MNNLYEYFKKINDENKLVQSYLIGNTTFDEIKNELYKVIKDFLLKDATNIDENPDIYILKPEKGIVSKDDIKDLLSNISTTSQFNNSKVYIIDKCEELNDYAYNAILKTLEEPALNVYALLLTTNIDSVKPTIVSRCQKIFISSESNVDTFDNELIEYTDKLIEIIETEGLRTIGSNPQIYNEIEDKDKLKSILNIMLNKYMDTLNSIVNKNSDDNIIMNNNTIDEISKKIITINENINNLNNNLNKNLSIDRIIYEIWRCKNENC